MHCCIIVPTSTDAITWTGIISAPVDYSSNQKTLLLNGTATISRTVSRFSTYSLNIPNSTVGFLSASSSADFGLGTGDFTIECWIYPTANPANGPGTLFDFRTGITASATTARINSSLQLMFYNGPSNIETTFTSATITLNAWSHVAFVRSSGTVFVYVNGTQQGSVAVASDLGSNQPLMIGNNQTSGYTFNGYINDFRITKGVARYTANFTAPTNYLNDSSYANTSLLLLADNQANSSGSFIDLSATANTITASGVVSINTSVKKYGSGSIFFDGSSGFLTIPSTSAFAVTTSTTPFTIETWVYPTAAGGCIFSEAYTGFGNTIPIALALSNVSTTPDYSSAGLIPVLGYYNGSSWISAAGSNTALTLNTWSHLACVFTGSTTKIYIDGTDVTKTSSPTPATTWGVTANNGDVWYVGRRWDTSASPYFQGYMDEFRFTKGVARYTSNFTPATIGFSQDANYASISLLVPMIEEAKTSNTTSSIFALAHGNGNYLYGGAGGALASSADGSNWITRVSGTASAINSVIYGGTKYMYAGAGGALGISTDAINWANTSGSGTSSNLITITYTSGRYYAAGAGGVIRSSNDGNSWFAVTSSTTSQINRIVYANNLYLYVGDSGAVGTSTDGIAWSARTSGVSGNLTSILWDGAKYVANGNSLISSTDGINWTVHWPGGSSGSKNGPEESYYDSTRSLHFLFGTGTIFIVSSNGQTWTNYNAPTTINDMAHNSSVIVRTGTGGHISTSTDGINWTTRTSGTAQSLSVLWNGTFFVTFGNSGGIFTSTDGITWTSRTSGTSSNINAGVATSTTTVLVTSTGAVVLRSLNTDCVTWTANNSITSSSIYCRMLYSSSLNRLVMPIANAIWTSDDHGVTWTNRGNGNNWFGCYYDGTYFYAVGYSVLRSTDGINWTTASALLGPELTWIHRDSTALYMGSALNSGPVINRSTDNGTTWKTALYCGFVTDVATNGAGQYVFSASQGFTTTPKNLTVATSAFGYNGEPKSNMSNFYSNDYIGSMEEVLVN
jgi:hypothetical protein